MCRLYGMRATHPTRPACELIDAQNSLIQQAVEDGRGLENPHGWGIGWVHDGATECARQVEPADESAEYRRNVLDTAAETVVAHVRRATVGDPCYENTHPFRDGEQFLAHNGHVGKFDAVRPKILEALPAGVADRIQGTTDSEHVFQLVRSYREEGDDMIDALRRAVDRLQRWTLDAGGEPELALNTLWVDRGELAGTKVERSLWYLVRDEPITCSICDAPHAHPPGDDEYRSVVVASEKITDEDWVRMPEGSVFEVDDDLSIRLQPVV
ncbi:MAG: class II glutamine amidotransferase [Bradymonadaceae bacterium]